MQNAYSSDDDECAKLPDARELNNVMFAGKFEKK
jgi:hypothetical protein